MLLEPAGVSIHADVAVVDRSERASLIGSELLRAGREVVGEVGAQHASLNRPRGEGVVDAEHDVSQGRILGQDQLVYQRSGIAGCDVGDLVAALRSEGVQRRLIQGEGVVGQHCEGLAFGRRSRAVRGTWGRGRGAAG